MQIVSLDRWEKQIQIAKGDGIRSALLIGQALQAISEGSLWRQTPAKNFGDYVEKTHGFKRSWAFAVIGVWKEWGDILSGLPSLSPDVTRLVRLLPYTTEENRLELLHIAAEIPDVRAFDNVIRELQGKTTTDACVEHVWELIHYKRCTVCGLKVRS